MVSHSGSTARAAGRGVDAVRLHGTAGRASHSPTCGAPPIRSRPPRPVGPAARRRDPVDDSCPKLGQPIGLATETSGTNSGGCGQTAARRARADPSRRPNDTST